MDYILGALDYAVANDGRIAAFLAVLAPALHLSLSNPEANALAEVGLVVYFLVDELAGRAVQVLNAKGAAPKA